MVESTVMSQSHRRNKGKDSTFYYLTCNDTPNLFSNMGYSAVP